MRPRVMAARKLQTRVRVRVRLKKRLKVSRGLQALSGVWGWSWLGTLKRDGFKTVCLIFYPLFNILSSESEKATDFHSWPNNNIRGCIYAGARGDWTTHQYTLNLSKASNVCVMISHLAQTKVFAVDFHLLNLLLKIVLALLLLTFWEARARSGTCFW